jgi:HPt (histidine-containing phosphotransfer) domain-containing protein
VASFDGLIEHAVALLGGAASSGLASILALARKFGARIENIESRVSGLEQRPAPTSSADLLTAVQAMIEQRDRVLEAKLRRAIGDASGEVRKEVDRLARDLERLQTAVAGAASGAELAEYIAAEAERWNEVHRSLGQIEGMLNGVRDRMRPR